MTRGLSSQLRFKEITYGRFKLGQSLALGLDFLIAAEVLKTVVAPSWTDIGQLAAVVGIRVILEFFLHKELEKEDRSLKN